MIRSSRLQSDADFVTGLKSELTIRSRPAEGGEGCRLIEVGALAEAIAGGELVWIDLLYPEESITRLLDDSLQLGSLTVEDCLLPVRMPKLDPFPEGAFVAAFALQVDENGSPRLQASALSMVFGPRYLLTARRGEIPELSRRLENTFTHEQTLPEQSGAALAHTALDALVDHHLPVAVRAAELAEDLEDQLDPGHEQVSISALEDLIVLRRDLLAFRRLGVAQQEVLRRLGRMLPDLRDYFTDVADNQREAIETAAATCDYIDGAIEAFRVRHSARQERNIRRVSLLAAIFAPMTLTIGLWGVNFPNIPGTDARWGWYIFVATQMTFVVLAIAYFQRHRLL